MQLTNILAGAAIMAVAAAVPVVPGPEAAIAAGRGKPWHHPWNGPPKGVRPYEHTWSHKSWPTFVPHGIHCSGPRHRKGKGPKGPVYCSVTATPTPTPTPTSSSSSSTSSSVSSTITITSSAASSSSSASVSSSASSTITSSASLSSSSSSSSSAAVSSSSSASGSDSSSAVSSSSSSAPAPENGPVVAHATAVPIKELIEAHEDEILAEAILAEALASAAAAAAEEIAAY